MLELDKIYLGDCNELILNLDDKSVDYVITSPPYNRDKLDKYDHYHDAIKKDDYLTMLISITDQLLRVTKNHIFFNIQQTFCNKEQVFQYIGHYYDKIKELIVWEKDNPRPACTITKSVTNAYEFIIVLGNDYLKTNGDHVKNVIHTNVYNNKIKSHHAVMHPKVCEWLIDNFTNDCDIILDPFMGTGTTAICARNKQRHFIGFEISEEYWKLSTERLTGDYEYNKSGTKKLF